MNFVYNIENLEITDYEIEIVERKLDNIDSKNQEVQAIVAMQSIKSSHFSVDMIANQFGLRRGSVSDAVDSVLEIGDIQQVGEARTGGRRANVYSYIGDEV